MVSLSVRINLLYALRVRLIKLFYVLIANIHAIREPTARVPYEKHSTGMFFYPPALREVLSVSLSVESDQRLCLWKLQAFEKA